MGLSLEGTPMMMKNGRLVAVQRDPRCLRDPEGWSLYLITMNPSKYNAISHDCKSQ